MTGSDGIVNEPITMINVTEWESTEALDAARTDPEWLVTVQQFVNDPDLHITARPAIYKVAVDVHPGDTL